MQGIGREIVGAKRLVRQPHRSLHAALRKLALLGLGLDAPR